MKNEDCNSHRWDKKSPYRAYGGQPIVYRDFFVPPMAIVKGKDSQNIQLHTLLHSCSTSMN
jgi:hypothetical protein